MVCVPGFILLRACCNLMGCSARNSLFISFKLISALSI